MKVAILLTVSLNFAKGNLIFVLFVSCYSKKKIIIIILLILIHIMIVNLAKLNQINKNALIVLL